MKTSFVSVLSALALFGLAACGTSTDSKGTGQPAQPQPEQKKPITLYIQNIYSGSPSAEEFKEQYGKLIQQKFPHIERIEYFSNATRPLDQVMLAKERMDIVITSQATFHTTFLPNSLQTDLTEFITKTGYNTGRLDPSSLELVNKLGGGKPYGLPVDAGGTYMLYNKDLFDKFGVAYPPNKMTWDQFADLSKKLSRTDNGVMYHGSALAPVNFLIRNPYALNHLDPSTGKADFSNPTWSRFLSQIADLYRIPGNEKTATHLTTSGVLNLFTKDRVAAMYSPIIANDLSLTFTFEALNFDFTHFPTMPNAPGNVQTYPNIYAVSSTSPHKEDAFDVIAFMTSDEVQLAKSKRGVFSTLGNKEIRAAFAQEAPEFIRKKNLAIFAEPNVYATPTNISEYTSTANGELNTALTEVIATGKDVNTALREAAEKANQKIEQAKSAKK
ncbi:extracellular solute-binding protein [Paenibacillus hemerocallicola]|uniref:Extracellular solute-binding protein n=1 Tax=Paenibacillus hemerocallicola TaxID=1172614 RepID=A0A5C4T6A5_9BACL|nr:extracellular solute-binding protein [Paenibacillus hemerocallicola]TNJ64170.1 extracellular solute-binding protein [Paenibacillus hemerocallicola]